MPRIIFQSVRNTIITLLILLLVGLGFFLVLFGDSIMEQIREEMASLMEESFPYQLDWEQMVLFPANNLVIKDFSMSLPDEERPFLTAEKVVVGLNFWELIRTRGSASVIFETINMESFEIYAPDPQALIPEIVDEDFRPRIRLENGAGLIGWEDHREEIKSISASLWPRSELGWEGSLTFALAQVPDSPLNLTGYWKLDEAAGRLEMADFPVNFLADFLPDDDLIIEEGRVSGEISLEYKSEQDLKYSGDFNLEEGRIMAKALEEELAGVRGQISLDRERVSFREVSARFNNTDLFLEGWYLMDSEEMALDLEVENLESGSVLQLAEKTGILEEELPELDGYGRVALQLRGTPADFLVEGRVNLPALQVENFHFSDLEGSFSYQDQLFSLHQLTGKMGSGHFQATGQLGSELSLNLVLEDIDLGALPADIPWPEEMEPRGTVEGRLVAAGPMGSIEEINLLGDIKWQDPILAGLEFKDIEGVFWTGGEKVFFSPLIIQDHSGGRAELQGTTDFSGQELDFFLRGQGIKLEEYLLAEEIKGQLELDGQLTGSLASPVFNGEFIGRELSWNGEQLERAEGRLQAGLESINIEEMKLVHAWGEMELAGNIDLEGNNSGLDLKVKAAGPCLSPLLEELDFPLELAGATRADLHLQGTLEKPRIQGQIELENGNLNGQALERVEVDFNWRDERLVIYDLKADLAGGSLAGRGRVDLDGEMDLYLEGEQVALEDIEEWEKQLPGLRGHASFGISLRGTWPDLEADGSLEVENITWDGEFLGTVTGGFSYQEGVIGLQEVTLLGQEGTYQIEGWAEVDPLGDLDVRLVSEETSLERLASLAGWDDIWIPMFPITLSGAAQVKGPIENPRIEIQGSAFYPAGELQVIGGGQLEGPYEATIAGPVDLDLLHDFLPPELAISGQGQIEVDIHYDEFWNIAGENTLEDLELNGISFARAGGSFSWQGGEPLFLDQSLWRKEDEKLQLQGFLPLDQDEETLDLEVFTQEFSLDFLASFLPDFPELGGRVSLDFRMAGSLEEPVLAGSGYLQEGVLRYFNFPGGVEDLEGEIRLEGDNLVFEEIKGRYSEGGSLNLGGKIGMEGWFFRHYDLLLEVEGLHIKHGSVDGYGDGEMTIKGPFDEPEMVGYLDVYDTVIKFPFDWPHEEIEDDIADDFHFELTFRPRSNIRVRDGNYDFQVQTGELTLDNRTGELEMVGEVSSRQGSVDFYNTSFRLIEGRARFHRFGESIPHISASAQTRVQDNQIIVYLEGPALDMDLSFSSQPPRDEQEIIELLVYRGGLGELVRGDLTGVVREELWRIIGETFRTSFLVHLETSISDFLELDEFKITPILLGEEERIEFHMGKALTDRIYLTYTQAFTATGDRRELGLEYRLGDNIFFSGSLQDEGQFQLGIEFSFPF